MKKVLCFCLALISQAIAQSNDYSLVMATNASGYTVAVWDDASSGMIQTATYSNGAWSAAMEIPNTSRSFPTPSVLMVDNSGNAVYVWSDNNSYDTRASVLPFKGTAWSAPVEISQANCHCFGVMANMDSSGNVVAVWSNLNTGFMETANLPSGGSWTAPISLSYPVSSPSGS